MKTYISLFNPLNISTYSINPLLLVNSFPTLSLSPSLCPSRVVRLVCVCCVCSFRLRLCCLVCVCCVCSFRLCCLVLCSIRCVSSVLCVMSVSSGSIVYLPIHSNALNSISLKRLSGSTCLTGFYSFRVFGVFGVFEVFKVVRLVQRFYSYNPLSKNTTLSKSHNSFSCPYRRNRTI